MDDILDLAIENISSFSKLKTFSRDRVSFCSSDNIRAYREETLLKQTLKDAEKNRTRIYQLRDNSSDVIIGVVALSTSRLDSKPALLIDYIFISNKFRRNNSSINYAKFSIGFTYELGLELQKKVGLSYVILYPDNEEKNLFDYYEKEYGFKTIHENVAIQRKTKTERWMYLPLQSEK